MLTTNRYFTIQNRALARIWTAVTCLAGIGILLRIVFVTSTLQTAIDCSRKDSIKVLLENQSSDSVILPGENEPMSILEASIELGLIDLANEELNKIKEKELLAPLQVLTPFQVCLQTKHLAKVSRKLRTAIFKNRSHNPKLVNLSVSINQYINESRHKTLRKIKEFINELNDNEIESSTGNTALQVAIEIQDIPMIIATSNMHNIDFSNQNKQGDTALHLAVKTKNVDIVTHLCNSIDDASIFLLTNNQKNTAFDMPKATPKIKSIINNRLKYIRLKSTQEQILTLMN